MKCLCLLITMSCLTATANAAPVPPDNSRFYAMPTLQAEQLNLVSHADENQDKLVRQILRQTTGNSGVIKILITKANLANIASKIKKKLVRQGISANRVTIMQSLYGPVSTTINALNRSGLAVVIEAVKFIPEICHYNNHDYRYRNNQEMNCAVKSNLQNSLVDITNKI